MFRDLYALSAGDFWLQLQESCVLPGEYSRNQYLKSKNEVNPEPKRGSAYSPHLDVLDVVRPSAGGKRVEPYRLTPSTSLKLFSNVPLYPG